MVPSENDTTYKGKKPSKKVREQWHQEAMQFIRQANTQHEQAATLFANALDHAKQAGEALLEAKHRVPYKQWGQFLRKHFDGRLESGRVYMRIARHWDDPRIVKARQGSITPMSIASFLDIITNKRRDPVAQPTKPTPVLPTMDDVTLARHVLLERFEQEIDGLEYEEVELLKENFSRCWEMLYERLIGTVLAVYEQDAADISDVYAERIRENEENKRSRGRGRDKEGRPVDR